MFVRRSPITSAELARSNRMYFIQTKSSTFDAEKATGNNLGIYANQRGVVPALREVKKLSQLSEPQMTNDDWLKIERHLDSLANAEFKVVSKQLVLVAKEDFNNSAVPTEIFINYGGLSTTQNEIVQAVLVVLLPKSYTFYSIPRNAIGQNNNALIGRHTES